MNEKQLKILKDWYDSKDDRENLAGEPKWVVVYEKELVELINTILLCQ